MCLSDLKKGQSATISEVPEGDLRHQLLRFGIAPGARVKCCCKLPMGPVVLRYGGQEIALGSKIARDVTVKH